jgi:hypothetical protein
MDAVSSALTLTEQTLSIAGEYDPLDLASARLIEALREIDASAVAPDAPIQPSKLIDACATKMRNIARDGAVPTAQLDIVSLLRFRPSSTGR